MKKVTFACAFLFILAMSASILESSYIGRIYIRADGNPQTRSGTNVASSRFLHIFNAELQRGNLVLDKIQDDPLAKMEHHRYKQFYQRLEVFGGQVIKHYKGGVLDSINGEYYQINGLDTKPGISRAEAIECLKNDLAVDDLVERTEEAKLIVYPVKDGGYYLAYQIVLEKEPGYSMTGIVDAKTKRVLLKYSNIQTENYTIGQGIGLHGDLYKFPTTLVNGTYYLADEKKVRPVNQRTLVNNSTPTDSDNYWDFDGAIVNAHAYLGLVYDYYFLSFGRNGIDDNNLDIIANVHQGDGYDGASWNRVTEQMYFLDPGPLGWRTAAALDVIGHEYTHGVTQFTSELIYSFESGALSEAFSDIMGTAIEFYCQPPDSSFNMADWVMGEDVYQVYGDYLRSLSDPNSKQQSPYGPDPCHLSQRISVPESDDNGGVHYNCTIYSHAYYLLAAGGTNKVSEISVEGIGIEKATKIFYRAWVYYLTSTSVFLDAKDAIVNSAGDLYGQTSTECAQTLNAMYAIGW